ncbi:hypothetical protein B0A49_02430 [Cryomyces minteri]|uniref:3-oxoacyl-[acyl-carrier-protein] reductase n=1 Tax=Cryomyces minteri TaxID=331657 RepID=A0A4U0XL74_9PEZI|nr:hypothetical protein B0A49_02430 [Cryomyces minteri]
MPTAMSGKTCLVTGSAGGLGKAIASALLEAGANVAICDLNQSRIDQCSAEFATFSKQLIVFKIDITDESQIVSLFEHCIAKFGRVDVLVNNAGLMDHFDPVGDLDKALWDTVIAVNLTAPYLVSKHAVKHMQEERSGVILNISSAAGVAGFRAGGLGKAIASALLEAGANVAICDLNQSRIDQCSAEFATFSKQLIVFKIDITDESQIVSLFEHCIAKFGRVDVLVNNAGLMDHFDPVGVIKITGGAADLDKALWDTVIAVNLTAPYLVSKHAVKHMQEERSGVILNISSAAGVAGFRAGAAYTASKHGLIGLTKNTAAYYSKKGIRCNAILPGAMKTNIADALATGMNMEGYQTMQTTAAMEPSDNDLETIAKLCLFLCSDDAGVVNGACVQTDGGWLSY